MPRLGAFSRSSVPQLVAAQQVLRVPDAGRRRGDMASLPAAGLEPGAL